MKNRKVAYVLLAFSVIIFLISLTGSYFYQRSLKTEMFYTSVSFTNENVGGFDVNSTTLTFGKVLAGGSSTRDVNLQNDFSFPVAAELNCKGSICTSLNFEKKIIAQQGEKKKISFTIYAPDNINSGFYDGNLTIKLRRKSPIE